MFFLLHYRFLVFARIDVSISRISTWPAYIFSWTFNAFSWLEQMSQLARLHFFSFCGQHACSVGQLMHSVGQNRCLSCLEQMSQLVISFWPTCMFSWPENMFFIFTYTTFFPKCSLRNMYCQIYVQLAGYMFSWPGYMFFSWPENTWGTMHVLDLASMHAELPEYRFSWLGCMFSCTFMNFSLHISIGQSIFCSFCKQ